MSDFIELRCPECGDGSFISESNLKLKLVPLRCHAPIHFPPAVMVVVKCPTCAGRGEWQTAVATVRGKCTKCQGTGKILEEQP